MVLLTWDYQCSGKRQEGIKCNVLFQNYDECQKNNGKPQLLWRTEAKLAEINGKIAISMFGTGPKLLSLTLT